MIRRAVVATVVVVGGLVVAAGPAHAVDPPLDDVTQVEAGTTHTCAVAAGAAWCWGDDTDGKLGDGSASPTSIASRVRDITGSGQLTGVAQVTAGETHSCARLTSGQVRCWGGNGRFQLGNGTTTPSSVPVIVINQAGNGPLTGVRQIAAGGSHTCALLVNGRVLCWGGGPGGQLGNGATTTASLPVPVLTANGVLTGVSQISTSAHHTCARRTDRTVRCWGVNEVGRIGDGSVADRRRAATVIAVSGPGPLNNVVHISAGARHTCAVLANGQARCWGQNDVRELGTGPNGPDVAKRPVVVRSRARGRPPLDGVRTITAGRFHTCALLRTGQVRCFGEDDDGQSGDGVRTGRTGPVPVLSATGTYDPPTPGNLTGITQVSAGADHLCARRNDGRALCWGRNEEGQGGSGAGPNDRLRPTSVLAPP
jgi:alpha-tubulin suppressor-like RCC1 family protein